MFFLLPILSLILLALNTDASVWNHLSSTVLPKYLQNTILLMIGVGIGTFLLGTGTAYLIAIHNFPGRNWLEWTLVLPMAMPAYILAMVYLELLDFSGPLQSKLRHIFNWRTPSEYWFPEIASLGGAALMLSFVLYPYVYLLSRNAFQQQSHDLTEAGRMLGDRSSYGLWKIILPMARPSIAVGLSLALMETLADFGTVQLFSIPTFTTGIYHTWFGTSNVPGAAQLSISLLCFVSLLIALERFSRRKQRYHKLGSNLSKPPRKELYGTLALAAKIYCLIPVFFGFTLPCLFLIYWSWSTLERWNLKQFFSDGFNSLFLAVLSSILALCLALLMNFGVRLHRLKLLRSLTRLASLGYALPGPVIALGVLVPLSWFDQQLHSWLSSDERTVNYWFSGSLFILVYAYLIRFLALAQGTLESGMASITPGIEDSGRLLGSTPRMILKDLHLPMLRGSLWTATLLVFVDVMKELPATMMLQPFNFSTLATRAFAYASDERLQESAPWCLGIVLVGLFPVIILNRKLRSSRLTHDTSHRLMPVPKPVLS